MVSRILLFFSLVLLVRPNIYAKENLDSIYQIHIDKLRNQQIAEYISLANNSDSKDVIEFWISKIEEILKEEDSTVWKAKLFHHKARTAYFNGEADKSKSYRLKSLALFKESEDIKGAIKQLNNLGNLYANTANHDSAIYAYKEALSLSEVTKDSSLLARSMLNLSTIYNNVGQKKEELNYLLSALDVGRSIQDSLLIGHCLYNLAVHYSINEEYEKSDELIKEVVDIYKLLGNSFGIASTFNIKAKNAFDNQNPQLALLYLDSSLAIYEEAGDFSRLAMGKLNVGEVAAELKDYKKAKERLGEAYEDFVKIKDYRFAAIALSDLAKVNVEEKDYDQAIKNLKEAIEISDSIGVLDRQIEYLLELSKAYNLNSQHKLAFQTLSRHLELNDSLMKVNNQETMREMEARFQNEKKELEIKNLEKEAQISEIELEKESQQNRILVIGLILTVLLIGFIGFSLYRKNKDNQIIRSQKGLLEEKNEELNIQKLVVEQKNIEITDSIQYAKKIQEAVLPPIDVFKSYFPNSFIFYKPKDIVAGDFYWFHKNGDEVLFAAADCTGHGVPGALVSVVCSNALNLSVSEYGLSNPAEILDKCQELVNNNLGNSEQEINDGMDLALCSYNLKERSLQYSGANNPLWIISKEAPKYKDEFIEYSSNSDEVLFEIKADKQAIGQAKGAKNFTNHELELNAGDRIYLFSDGFIDQFGGSLGKKLKSKSFKELILKNQNFDINQQEVEFDKFFLSWKGELEQLDDVCLLGVEV